MATSADLTVINSRLEQVTTKSKEVRSVVIQDIGSTSSILDLAASFVGLGLEKMQRGKEALILLDTVDRSIATAKTVSLPKVLSGAMPSARLIGDLDSIKKTLESIAPDMQGWNWTNAVATVANDTKKDLKTGAGIAAPIIFGLIVLIILVKVAI